MEIPRPRHLIEPTPAVATLCVHPRAHSPALVPLRLPCTTPKRRELRPSTPGGPKLAPAHSPPDGLRLRASSTRCRMRSECANDDDSQIAPATSIACITSSVVAPAASAAGTCACMQ